MNIYNSFFISSEVVSYVVRVAVFSWLEVTAQCVRDLPFLWIICVVAASRLAQSGLYYPEFGKDGKLPCAAFHRCSVMVVRFSGCNIFD